MNGAFTGWQPLEMEETYNCFQNNVFFKIFFHGPFLASFVFLVQIKEGDLIHEF